MAEAPGIVIAAPSSSSGKTLVTLGLIAALRRAGRRVAAAKVGPDYIDPRFHEAAGAAPCFNLDPWAMRSELLAALARRAATGADILVIEGVMGLFDGPACGGGSTADLAARLELPVVLVVDAAHQAQSVAALTAGFANHRADCRIAGVILNRVASPRHESLLHDALSGTSLPVLGAVGRHADLALPSRHLGLVQAGEHSDLARFVDQAARHVGSVIDLEELCALAAPLPDAAETTPLPPLGQRIAVARDEAFAFAYPHLLEGWHAKGAEIAPFSPLADESPDPQADAVYLPGGYPELHAERLAAARTFRDGLIAAEVGGALVYGECGGFMVLGNTLTDAGGKAYPMTGLLPHATSFAEPRLNLGYRRLDHDGALPWPRVLRGHEFHYSTETTTHGAGAPLFEAWDADGRALEPFGLRRGLVMGSYAHVVDLEAGL